MDSHLNGTPRRVSKCVAVAATTEVDGDPSLIELDLFPGVPPEEEEEEALDSVAADANTKARADADADADADAESTGQRTRRRRRRADGFLKPTRVGLVASFSRRGERVRLIAATPVGLRGPFERKALAGSRAEALFPSFQIQRTLRIGVLHDKNAFRLSVCVHIKIFRNSCA